MLTEEQIKERVHYLGGSEAAAVLGLSRWKTPLQVWAEKTGLIQPEQVDNLAVEVGNELEELVAKLFSKRTGKKVHRVTETVFHPVHQFLGANLDRRVVGEDAILECKAVGAWAAKEWAGEDVPQEYVLQCLHYLAVTGKQRAYIAVLVGGNREFKWKVVERDEKMIQEIVSREVAFWKGFIETKIMPKLITRDDSDTLFKLFPNGDDGAQIVLGDEADKIVESIKSLQQDAILLDGTIEKEKNALKAMLGGNAVAITGRFKITWKNQVTNRIDVEGLKSNHPELCAAYVKPAVSRTLRMTEIKKTEEK